MILNKKLKRIKLKKVKTKVKKEKTFRIRSKSFFLTYSGLRDLKSYDNKLLFEKILLSLECLV